MKLRGWRAWADDILVAAGLVCFGVGLALTCPSWVLWFYAGAVFIGAGVVVARC
jgi:hypothetical protein